MLAVWLSMTSVKLEFKRIMLVDVPFPSELTDGELLGDKLGDTLGDREGTELGR